MIISISGKIGSGKDLIGKIINYLLTGGEQTYESIEGFLEYYNDGIDKYPYQIKKWADNLKDIVCILIGCTREQLEDADFKEKELGEEWRRWYYFNTIFIVNSNKTGRVSKYFNSEQEAEDYKNTFLEFDWRLTKDAMIKSEILTPRLLLQLLGTECGRNIIHPDIWVNALMNHYDKALLTEVRKSMLSNEINKPVNSPSWIITDTRFPNELQAVKDRRGISIRVERGLVERTGKMIQTEEHESETSLDSAIFDYYIDNNSTIENLIDKVKIILKKRKHYLTLFQ